MSDANAQYRDSVFRSFFNEPRRLLSLCNAVLGTDYDNPDKLEINTLEGIFFDSRKNDISCSINNQFLLLVEHQSSVNNNMPFRFLAYVTELLNKLVTDKRKLYKEQLIKFPAPKFFVLYNGNEFEPVEKIMRLSDAFGGDSSSLELIVTAYNINRGVNAPLLGKCPYLRDYNTLVGEVKDGLAKGLSLRNAIIRAVKFCLDNGIMGDYLVEHSEEVFNMLALEWNMDDAKQAWQEEAREQERESVAVKLIRMGLQFEDIQKATNLSIQRLKELANKKRDR